MAWWDSFTGGNGNSGGGTDWWGALWSGISSYSQGRQQEDQMEQQGLISREAIAEQGRQGRQSTEFEMGLSDYYKRKNQEDRRKGFSNFGQFATNQYAQPYTPTPVGPAPTAFSFEEQQRTLGGG
mgnify:CR=1 FL=1